MIQFVFFDLRYNCETIKSEYVCCHFINPNYFMKKDAVFLQNKKFNRIKKTIFKDAVLMSIFELVRVPYYEV